MVCHIFCCSLFHVGIAVFIQSFRSFYFSSFLLSHRYHQPRARAVFRSLIPFHFAPFHFQWLCLSHPANPCGCSIVPFHSTKLHHPAHNPFSFITLHYASLLYIRSLHTALAFPTAPFGQKNPPNQLPAAPVHSALRYPCPGHSLHSQRLAHNAHAAYFVSFLYTRICLAIHARSRLFLLFGLNLLLPRQPPTTHPKYSCSCSFLFSTYKSDRRRKAAISQSLNQHTLSKHVFL